jgi:NhaP-type Na+/H+ or K+/H+ antiporter
MYMESIAMATIDPPTCHFIRDCARGAGVDPAEPQEPTLELETAFAVIAGVLVVSALAAGLVERAPLSFPMLFLGLGFLIGDRGLELISIGLDNQVLQVVAVVTLALVLFLDAVNPELSELRRAWLPPFLVLGPGTLLVAGLLAGAGMLLLDLPVVLALLLGTILASADPVVLRDVLRDPRLPRSVRRTLSVEAGTNDIVVLPILLVLIAIAHADLGGPAEWLVFLGQLFVLGPAAGFAVGAAGAWTMGWVDQRFRIRREYQSLYGIGLVLAAYVAAEAVGGDGFLAAFAAGLGGHRAQPDPVRLLPGLRAGHHRDDHAAGVRAVRRAAVHHARRRPAAACPGAGAAGHLRGPPGRGSDRCCGWAEPA